MDVANVIGNVDVIERETLEQSNKKDTADLLRDVNGIELGRNGGPGQNASLFIRGSESDHTLVLLDGVPINPATIGNAPLEHIFPEQLQRVEVVRGPLSSLQGSSAIGGVINLVTMPDLPPGTRESLTVKAGSDDTVELQAGVQHAHGPWGLGVNLSHASSEGFATRDGGTVDNGFLNNGLNAFASYRFGDSQLKLQAFHTQGNTEYLGGFVAPFTPLDQDFVNSLFSASLNSQISPDWQSRLTLSRFRDEIDQNQPNYLAQLDYTHSQRYRLDWQNDWDIASNHRLTGGVTLEREKVRSLSFGTAIDAQIDNVAVFASTQHRWNEHQVVGAVRLNHHELFGDHPTWNLGYGFSLNEATDVRASFGTGFRAPTATDLYGYGGNTSLEPEQSRSFEIGVKHRLNTQQLVEVTAYHTRIRDLIVTNFYDLDGIDQFGDGWLLDDPLNENINRAKISGIEVSYRFEALPWRVNISADHKRPWDETNDVILSRRARTTAHASVRYAKSDWALGASVQYQGKRDDSLFNSLQLAPYAVVDVDAHWRLSRNVRLEASLENLFDEDYELAGTYNTPGRSALIGLRITSD